MLSIQGLSVFVEDKEILKNLSLNIGKGQVHAIMGPNGSGKSTLAYTLMGHPKYTVSSGEVLFKNKNILNLPVDERSKLGIFLALQSPYEIEGVTVRDFLRQAYNAHYGDSDKRLSSGDFSIFLDDQIELLGIEKSFVDRYLNVGFSGGEKKMAETLQLAVLQPQLAILDELDSGLDVDALRKVCDVINEVRSANPDMSLLIITHYQRILKYLRPDVVHVMKDGNIIKSGDKNLSSIIEEKGYV